MTGQLQACTCNCMSDFCFVTENIETNMWRLHENGITGGLISKSRSHNVWKEQKEGQ